MGRSRHSSKLGQLLASPTQSLPTEAIDAGNDEWELSEIVERNKIYDTAGRNSGL